MKTPTNVQGGGAERATPPQTMTHYEFCKFIDQFNVASAGIKECLETAKRLDIRWAVNNDMSENPSLDFRFHSQIMEGPGYTACASVSVVQWWK